MKNNTRGSALMIVMSVVVLMGIVMAQLGKGMFRPSSGTPMARVKSDSKVLIDQHERLLSDQELCLKTLKLQTGNLWSLGWDEELEQFGSLKVIQRRIDNLVHLPLGYRLADFVSVIGCIDPSFLGSKTCVFTNQVPLLIRIDESGKVTECRRTMTERSCNELGFRWVTSRNVCDVCLSIGGRMKNGVCT
jgi:hypothetical protein